MRLRNNSVSRGVRSLSRVPVVYSKMKQLASEAGLSYGINLLDFFRRRSVVEIRPTRRKVVVSPRFLLSLARVQQVAPDMVERGLFVGLSHESGHVDFPSSADIIRRVQRKGGSYAREEQLTETYAARRAFSAVLGKVGVGSITELRPGSKARANFIEYVSDADALVALCSPRSGKAPLEEMPKLALPKDLVEEIQIRIREKVAAVREKLKN